MLDLSVLEVLNFCMRFSPHQTLNYVKSAIYSPGAGNDRQTSFHFRVRRELAVEAETTEAAAIKRVCVQLGRESPNKERPALTVIAQGHVRADTLLI